MQQNMEKLTYVNNANSAYIDELYQQYLNNPESVDTYWQKFFEGYELGSNQPGAAAVVSNKEVAVTKLINAYRSRGHLIAQTKAVMKRRSHKADLSLEYFGLSEADMDTVFEAGKEIRIGAATLRQILDHLKACYCGSIGVEYMYCQDERLRQWLYQEMEPTGNRPTFSLSQKTHTLKMIDKAVTFESFLQTKYVGKKRFSLEGCESVIPALDAAIETTADLGVREFVLGMAHRGRLNVLVNIFGKSYENVFSEFEGSTFAKGVDWDGDVKYHMGQSSDIVTRNGHEVHLSLLANPSHLEAVNPVVEGVVHAKRKRVYGGDSRKIIPILIHGDAAFSGQGVNYEVTNISRVKGYENGGTVHIILNNQIGFTTSNREGRSSVYCTDLAKVTESPVFHVNADDPMAVVHATQLAVRIRQEFGIDVYVDIIGYRRYGHNEGDEPRFTQPLMYRDIDSHPNIRELFLKQLIQNGDVTQAQADQITAEFKQQLQDKLDYTKTKKPKLNPDYFKRFWSGYRVAKASDFEKSIETGVAQKAVAKVAKVISEAPDSVKLFRKMEKLLQQRKDFFFKNKQIDWAMGELLAYGTLLAEGHAVRISGQDCQRGTFSHRHAVIRDVESEEAYVPLSNIQKNQATFEVYNSILSEYCVLGFEYGYSMASPDALTIWEAQFGDFSNGAQIIMDQFISSSQSKWQRMSGITLLLPHGYEGQGPEHSSARLERYLQLTAENNMYVVNVTTPSNYFHLLRRQVKNEFRIPLVVMSPKSLLRHPKVVSPIEALFKGRFQEIIDDSAVKAASVKRVVMCTGKVYYDLEAYRDANNIKNVAIVRLEQLYPLPQKQLQALRKRYAHVKDWVWLQEEPENMGAWTHLLRHLRDWNLTVMSREEGASPATGMEKMHIADQEKLVKTAFKLK